MSRGCTVWAVVLGGLFAAVAVRAQDGGPRPAVPSSFRSLIAVDDRFEPKVKPPKKAEDRDPRDRTRKMHDLVVERGLNPTVAVFTRTPPTVDSAAAKLAKLLNPLTETYRGNNFGAFVVFLLLQNEFPLDDTYVEGNPMKGFVREDFAMQLRALADQLAAPKLPLGLAARKSEQTDAWGIADETDLTVVLYNRMKVVKRWDFAQGTPPTDEQLQQIIAETTKVAAGP